MTCVKEMMPHSSLIYCFKQSKSALMRLRRQMKTQPTVQSGMPSVVSPDQVLLSSTMV